MNRCFLLDRRGSLVRNSTQRNHEKAKRAIVRHMGLDDLIIPAWCGGLENEPTVCLQPLYDGPQTLGAGVLLVVVSESMDPTSI